jgi:hypothetical protein
MRHHTLKTLPPFYERVEANQKNFEVRKNDRDFQVGDIVHLKRYEPGADKDLYSHYTIARKIIYILHDGQFGIELGYCVLGLGLVPEGELDYV